MVEEVTERVRRHARGGANVAEHDFNILGVMP